MIVRIESLSCRPTGIKRLSWALFALAFLLLFFDGPCAAKQGAPYYAIQVASYKDKQQAQERADYFLRQRQSAFIKAARIEGRGRWHRVYIGTYPTESKARQAAATLQQEGLVSDCYVRPLYENEKPVDLPVSPPSSKLKEKPKSTTFFRRKTLMI